MSDVAVRLRERAEEHIAWGRPDDPFIAVLLDLLADMVETLPPKHPAMLTTIPGQPCPCRTCALLARIEAVA